MVIRGLLLDFYGTVVEDDDDVVEAIAAEVAGRAAVPVNPRQATDAWMREVDLIAAGPGFVPLRECMVRGLAATMAELGCDGDAAELYRREHARWRSPELRPGTREFLSGARLPICLVSDADRAELLAVTARHGLVFDAIVTSQDVRAYKPDPAPFARALAALSLRPDEVLHVGDSVDADLRGAYAMGIRTVWVNRRGLPAPGDVPFAYEIADLSGLPAILGRPGRVSPA